MHNYLKMNVFIITDALKNVFIFPLKVKNTVLRGTLDNI